MMYKWCEYNYIITCLFTVFGLLEIYSQPQPVFVSGTYVIHQLGVDANLIKSVSLSKQTVFS